MIHACHDKKGCVCCAGGARNILRVIETICECVCVCVSVCVCLYVCERIREKKSMCLHHRECERERERE